MKKTILYSMLLLTIIMCLFFWPQDWILIADESEGLEAEDQIDIESEALQLEERHMSEEHKHHKDEKEHIEHTEPEEPFTVTTEIEVEVEPQATEDIAQEEEQNVEENSNDLVEEDNSDIIESEVDESANIDSVCTLQVQIYPDKSQYKYNETVTLYSSISDNNIAISSYDWEVNKGSGWQSLNAASSPSYSFTLTPENKAYNYRLKVSY